MLSNSQIKLFKSLHSKKFRVAENQFIIEGHRLIEEAFRAKTTFDGIWCTEEYAGKNNKLLIALKRAGNKWETTSAKSLSQICDSRNNQGIIALLTLPEQTVFKADDAPILLLDNISDPGNMGTILRTAEWFGVKNLILSPKCVDIYNSKVIRSAMGAHFHLNQMIQDNLMQVIPRLKKEGFSIIGADMDGTSITTFSPPQKWALVLGNEAHGLSPHIKSLLDERITVPKSGKIESLNVAVAGGVILNSLV
ncbi:MAG: RNA methyltransferase [Candidatus Marinimicrobia bacterium]|nr:RNA methyltransferase [Candidatus Neomarinimicrobiota bacterium]